MLEPSPTPWHLFDNGTEIWAQGPPDAPVIVVADTQFFDGPASERARADAQRIVDAVNAYDGLRELVDAQAARLAAVEAERDKYQALWCETARMVHEERERATRLAALEQAARVWAHDGSHYAESALLDAIEALDAPPGESP